MATSLATLCSYFPVVASTVTEYARPRELNWLRSTEYGVRIREKVKAPWAGVSYQLASTVTSSKPLPTPFGLAIPYGWIDFSLAGNCTDYWRLQPHRPVRALSRQVRPVLQSTRRLAPSPRCRQDSRFSHVQPMWHDRGINPGIVYDGSWSVGSAPKSTRLIPSCIKHASHWLPPLSQPRRTGLRYVGDGGTSSQPRPCQTSRIPSPAIFPTGAQNKQSDSSHQTRASPTGWACWACWILTYVGLGGGRGPR
ncbi:hypothetical protein B0I35DRAFT_431952 [Stachybotrys elegans]|uniref:Uncharacterized protein n=1 Tax=Stachybotrys elegans TaxID=80388 RepID=A0A8K0SNX4_9HYPO|nr:hypothetical protein B0I35DRAFT_431952 [Stachybotrys elegans]